MPFAICLPHPHSPPICLGLVRAELGLAPFWKMTVFFLAGRGWTGLLAALWFGWEWGLPLATRSYSAPAARESESELHGR